MDLELSEQTRADADDHNLHHDLDARRHHVPGLHSAGIRRATARERYWSPGCTGEVPFFSYDQEAAHMAKLHRSTAVQPVHQCEPADFAQLPVPAQVQPLH